MNIFTDEFKTLFAKTVAYLIVFIPIVITILIVGYLERGV